MSKHNCCQTKISENKIKLIINNIKKRFFITEKNPDKHIKVKLCNKIIKSLKNDIEKIIYTFDYKHLLYILLADLNELYSIKQKSILQNNNEYSLEFDDINCKINVLKSLVEIVSCEQKKGAKYISSEIYEKLLALVMCFISYGNYADIIKYIDDSISIENILSMKFPNFNEKFINIKEEKNNEIDINQINLEELYNENNENRELAFKEEFNIKFKELIDLVKYIISLDNNVYCKTYEEFIRELQEHYTYSKEEISKIVDNFLLTYQGNWFEDTEKYYQPWIHKRDYSFLIKPFILTKDNYLYYEDNHLQYMIYNLIKKIENGIYSAKTKTMNNYIHKNINRKGHLLTEYVYEWYKNNTDLYIQKEVKIPFNKKELIIGDIDIFILNNEIKKIFLIECKNIQGLSPKEIYNQFNKLSEDNKKHKKRVEWVTNNIDKIEEHFKSDKLKIKNYEIEDFFLLSEYIVPMFYIDDIKICTLTKLIKIEQEYLNMNKEKRSKENGC